MVSVCSIIDEKRKEKAWSACLREEKKFVTEVSLVEVPPTEGPINEKSILYDKISIEHSQRIN